MVTCATIVLCWHLKKFCRLTGSNRNNAQFISRAFYSWRWRSSSSQNGIGLIRNSYLLVIRDIVFELSPDFSIRYKFWNSDVQKNLYSNLSFKLRTFRVEVKDWILNHAKLTKVVFPWTLLYRFLITTMCWILILIGRRLVEYCIIIIVPWISNFT